MKPTLPTSLRDLPLYQLSDLDVEKLSDEELKDLRTHCAEQTNSPQARKKKTNRTEKVLSGKSKSNQQLLEDFLQ